MLLKIILKSLFKKNLSFYNEILSSPVVNIEEQKTKDKRCCDKCYNATYTLVVIF